MTERSSLAVIPEPGRVPRFTIVTPSLNQAPFIDATIRSVLTQEGRFEIEYLVIDGGSTDGSVEIISRYAAQVASGEWPARCTRLTMGWVSQPDRGQSDAINQGIRRATGGIVAYINSDDEYLPGAFEAVARAFASDASADVIFGNGNVVGAHGELQWEWVARPYDQRVMTTYYFMWNSFTNYVMQQATFWKRHVHERIGFFDESFHYVMDAEFWIRASAAGLRLVHLPQKLAAFRLIEGTKSASSPTVFWEDYLEIFRRYHGAQALAPYFGYYYYNLARHRDLDIDRALADGRVVFARWSELSSDERDILERESRRGFALSCLLTARELLSAGRQDEATRTFRRGVGRAPTRYAYLATLDYVISRALGRAGRAWLDRVRRFLILQNKRRGFDCRQEPLADS